jgi:spore maturation protein CgeB
MKLVFFGLSISSSWGNGHATLLRGLFRALIRRGHQIVFFERDVPYYAANRDLTSFDHLTLHLYSDWNDAVRVANAELRDADVGVVTSYCFDGIAASDLILSSTVRLRVFYDLDTPVTLARVRAGETLSYIGPRGLRDFDLILSYTGGIALDELRRQLAASAVAPLYGSVDPEVHYRTGTKPHYAADLSYIGTYAQDRQDALEALFIQPARGLPEKKFVIAGASYPATFPWSPNIHFVRHLPPHEHAAFYSSSRLTLNVTRSSMACMGYCPSGRFFEAAACGTPILSDNWQGLEQFFTPGSEILIAETTEDATGAIGLSDCELARIAAAARDRVMSCHTADRRAGELERLLESAASRTAAQRVSEPERHLHAEA